MEVNANMQTAAVTICMENVPNWFAMDCWISGMPDKPGEDLYTPVSKRMNTVVEQISRVSM